MRSFIYPTLAALLLGCEQNTAPKTYMNGTITSRAQRGHTYPQMLVERLPGDAASPNTCNYAAWFSLYESTNIRYRDGSAADTTTLTLGRGVSVRTDDQLWLDSCPRMGGASEVIIDP